jgi:Mlc titration factor MtfA (ptsG expression regulator)
MLFSYRKHERRQELLAEPFPEQWLSHLRNNVFLYRLLSEAEQGRVRDALRIFIAEKYWEGCSGLTMSDEIKVTVAANACLLVLGFEHYYFDELKTILVYPGGYLAQDRFTEEGQFDHRLGEAHHRGPVVLSWWDARWDSRRIGRRNLVLHEFAHKLAELNDPHSGTPPIAEPAFRGRWEEAMAAEYEQLVQDVRSDREPLLDPCGATSRAEFFAVAAECFFMQPLQLRRRHSRLYEILAEWFNQDPAERALPSAEDCARAEAMESEYFEHALAELADAIRRYPDLVDAYRRRADIYYQRGDYDRALADYNRVIQLAPDDATAYSDRGAVYMAQGDHERALADSSEAIRLDPSHAAVYHARFIICAGNRKEDSASTGTG